MLQISIKNIFEHLRQTYPDMQLQTETQQIACVLRLAGRDFPLFIKTDESEKVLQVLIFIPCMIVPRASAEVGRLLHFLNKELELPGFGMDETAGVVFYRCVFPTSDGKLDTVLLDNLLASIPNVAQAFSPVIVAAAGGKSFETMINQVRDLLKRFAQRLGKN